MEEKLEEAVQRNVNRVIQESQHNILSSLDELISNKLSDFEVTFSQRQLAMNESQLAKIESATSSSYSFKRKGNEEQFKHSVKVMDKLKEASCHLASDKSDSKVAAQNKITEGMELIKHRQKLIKLADSSKFGWKVVENYQSKELVDDSDDDKKMNKAETKCEKQAKDAREDRIRKSRRRWNPQQLSSSDGQRIQVIDTRATGQSTSKPGICFACGVPGHWRKDCPQMVQKSQPITKISNTCCNKSDLVHKGQESNTFKAVIENQNKTGNSPAGRLKENIDEWINIGAHEYIISVVRDGYRIPFYLIPDPVILRNNISALDNPDIVQTEIEKLLIKGCVSEVSYIPTVVNPLTVSFNRSGKARLVLDCRHINLYLFKFRFKLEDASVARYMFSQGDYVFNFDLQSAYHHIEIFEPHQRYLGFCWSFEGHIRYFIFKVLPFGISTAAHIFTKVTRSFVSYWRNLGFKIVMYLDDGLAGAHDYDTAFQVSSIVKNDLIKCGFLISEEKSTWTPAQQTIWLGCGWDFVTGTVSITEARLDRLFSMLEIVIDDVLKDRPMVKARFLACLIGQIISMQTGMGNVTRFRTRYMLYCLQSKASWDGPVMINKEVLDELVFWKENLYSLNGQSLSNIAILDASLEVFSDASHIGYGGYILNKRGSAVVGAWSEQEACLSSTWRELVAVSRVMNSLMSCLEGQTIKWYTDNKNVKHILEVGSKKRVLQQVASDIKNNCESSNINLSMNWIARSQNTYSDFLSRCNDSDDWQVVDDLFMYLDCVWGPHTVDRFATDHNTKCARFNSRWWCPGTEAVDAFTVNWSDENNWLVPLPRLVCQVLAKLQLDNAKGTIIVPQWKSSPYWPLLCPSLNQYSSYVKYVMDLNTNCTKPGRGKNGVFASLDLQCSVRRAISDSGIHMDARNIQLGNKIVDYLLKSKSDNTTCKYYSYFNKWEKYIHDQGHSSMPAHPVHIALFMTNLLEAGATFHVLSSTKYAIKWYHELHGHSDPTNNSFVTNLLESSKRHALPKTKKKEPLSVEHLRQLCDMYIACDDLLIIRDLCMIILGFSGFLRFDEISSLKCNDVKFMKDYIELTISKSKTDQYRFGNTIVISQGRTSACPVSMLRRYFSLAKIDNNSDFYLFRPIFRSGKLCSLIYKNKSLSYTRTRECILSRLRLVVGDLNIGLHSLRAGGATAAANANVNERCWKRHGRWKSESAKDGYAADSLNNMLQVTKALDL